MVRAVPRSRASNVLLAAAPAALIAIFASCGGSSASASASARSERAALASYLAQVEPLRRGVNRLLEGADPILRGYHGGRTTPSEAARRMAALERRFGAYTVDVFAIRPTTPQLRALHSLYAHTFVLEDAYLSALALALRENRLEGLPDTEAAQREAIIRWRVGLEVLARRLAVRLPADLAIAGRGEIRPSPTGS
jgi:hypothetical protein